MTLQRQIVQHLVLLAINALPISPQIFAVYVHAQVVRLLISSQRSSAISTSRLKFSCAMEHDLAVAAGAWAGVGLAEAFHLIDDQL
jgi:hypothetical protein